MAGLHFVSTIRSTGASYSRPTNRVNNLQMVVIDLSDPTRLAQLLQCCTIVDDAAASSTNLSATSRCALVLLSKWTSSLNLFTLANCDVGRLKGPANKVKWPELIAD